MQGKNMFRKRQLSGSNLPQNVKLHIVTKYIKENVPPQLAQVVNEVSGSPRFKSVKETPKKTRQNSEEPVTPNTNFKLLTSLAATLDYANCSTPKSSRRYDTIDRQICSSVTPEFLTRKSQIGKLNRKEKSLAVICARFLSMYPINPSQDEKIIVSLDEACVNLGVERRRLYDIVNVFESIDILTKTGKNQYSWFGKNNLIQSLQKLKAAALKERMPEKLQYIIDTECITLCKQSGILNDVQNFKTFDKLETIFPTTSPTTSSPDLRREKSLGIMSQKFLMLFLVSPEKIISLVVAAKVLNAFLQKTEKSTQIKTQIRRLYDIANVLSSIGLIQKEITVADHGRKPAFKYIGPDLEKVPANSPKISSLAMKQSVQSRRSLIRHSSFQEICAVAEMEHQKLSLMESNNSAPPFDSKLVHRREISSKNFKDLNFYTASSTTSKIESNDTQSYVLTNPVSPSKEAKVDVCQTHTQPVHQISHSQTIPLSLEQRDAILQSLNICLSSHQIAAIYLDGSTEPENHNSSCNMLKIVNKNSISNELCDKTVIKLSSQEEIESSSNSDLIVNSTQNNSPGSLQNVDSLLNIHSGCVTPYVHSFF